MGAASPALDGIPPELVDNIVRNITRPTDLKTLCRTTRSLQTAATPILYKAVTLKLGTAAFSGFLSDRNPGHMYIRDLRILKEPCTCTNKTCSGCIPPGGEDSHFDIAVMRALAKVPPGKLESLILPHDLHTTSDFFRSLVERQQNPTTLSVGPIFESLHDVWSHASCPSDWLASVLHLRLPERLGSIFDLQAYSTILRRATGIKSLDIGSQRFTETVDREEYHSVSTQSLQSWSENTGVLFAELFRGFIPTDAASAALPPLSLDSLTFRNVFFRNGGNDLFSRVINFGSLSKLEVLQCNAVGRILQTLIAHGELQLKHLGLEIEHRQVAMLDALLGKFSTLRHLSLTTRRVSGWVQDFMPHMPMHLAEHSSLEVLVLTMTDDELFPVAVPLDFIKQLHSDFKNLTELGVTLPEVSIPQREVSTSRREETNEESLERLAYGRSRIPAAIPEDMWSQYEESLISIARSPSLRALHIATPPSYRMDTEVTNVRKMSTDLEELMAYKFASDLKSFALWIMSHIEKCRQAAGLPSVRVLHFGDPPAELVKRSYRQPKMLMTCFVPTWQRDFNGNVKLSVEPVFAKDVKHVDDDYFVVGIDEAGI